MLEGAKEAIGNVFRSFKNICGGKAVDFNAYNED